MQKLKILFPVFIILLSNILSGRIINVPKDYSSIQSAIEAAQSLDTVLVERAPILKTLILRENTLS